MTILDEILAHKATEVSALPDRPATGSAPRRSLRASLLAHGPVALIAEIKRKSPSRPLIRADFDPPAMARAYERGGAAALSVLTDEAFFGGHLDDLVAARAGVELPVLRKDFLIDPRQVAQAARAGADAVLLIAAALDDRALAEMMQACDAHGVEFLLEVHTEPELMRALACGAPLVGINNRDLHAFTVDLARSGELAAIARSHSPQPPLLVSESGIATPADRDRLAGWGIQAMLVGESLLRQDDLEQAARGLLA